MSLTEDKTPKDRFLELFCNLLSNSNEKIIIQFYNIELNNIEDDFYAEVVYCHKFFYICYKMKYYCNQETKEMKLEIDKETDWVR